MKVSVVIPAYNEEKYIEKCLISLTRQEQKADEIIVVDNNSTDKTISIAKKYGVRIIKEEKQGMIYARNRGFNEAKFEIIARTDADSILPPQWISKIRKNFKDKNLSAVGGPAFFFNLPSNIQISHFPSIIFFIGISKLLKHDSVYGPNMSLRKSAWEKVKNEVCLIDSDIHEDIDLSMHLNDYIKIKFDKSLTIYTSPRKHVRIDSMIEYGFRLIKTLRHKRKFATKNTPFL